MKARTRIQETLYLEAMGYAWGRKDAQGVTTRELCAGSGEFASWYSLIQENTGEHHTLADAWRYFISLSNDDQRQLGTRNMRLAYSPYLDTARNGTNPEREENATRG